jgi:hypothetical protein
MNHIQLNHEVNPFIYAVATAVVQKLCIDPKGRNLVGYVGSGYSSNNLEAVANWVRDSIQQMTDSSGSLLCILTENFNDEFSIYSDAMHIDA